MHSKSKSFVNITFFTSHNFLLIKLTIQNVDRPSIVQCSKLYDISRNIGDSRRRNRSSDSQKN